MRSEVDQRGQPREVQEAEYVRLTEAGTLPVAALA